MATNIKPKVDDTMFWTVQQLRDAMAHFGVEAEVKYVEMINMRLEMHDVTLTNEDTLDTVTFRVRQHSQKAAFINAARALVEVQKIMPKSNGAEAVRNSTVDANVIVGVKQAGDRPAITA